MIDHDPIPKPSPEQIAPERAGPVWGQLDLRFEESSRMLDARVMDVVRREASVAQKEHDLQHVLTEAHEQRAELERARAELAAMEQARRELDERVAEVARRETTLNRREQELRQAVAQQDEQRAALERSRAELAELEQVRRLYALAQAEELRSEAERGRAELANADEAHRRIAASLAEVAERERAVSDRKAEVEVLAQAVTAEREEREQREALLMDAVKAAAKREAETVVRAAHEQARLILASANAARETPSEIAPSEEPVEEPDSQRVLQ